ncbi:hypothetical protein FALBO_9005, partial [Fusarium albosuccineum]
MRCHLLAVLTLVSGLAQASRFDWQGETEVKHHEDSRGGSTTPEIKGDGGRKHRHHDPGTRLPDLKHKGKNERVDLYIKHPKGDPADQTVSANLYYAPDAKDKARKKEVEDRIDEPIRHNRENEARPEHERRTSTVMILPTMITMAYPITITTLITSIASITSTAMSTAIDMDTNMGTGTDIRMGIITTMATFTIMVITTAIDTGTTTGTTMGIIMVTMRVTAIIPAMVVLALALVTTAITVIITVAIIMEAMATPVLTATIGMK